MGNQWDLPNDLDEVDFTRPSLARMVDTGHPFAIPWNHQMQPIFGGFKSSQIMAPKGPWVPSSPFEESSVRACSMVFESNGGSYTYRDAFSSQSQSNSDHLSVSGSISVGPPFLKAEASGQYDKTVVENQNGIQASRISSYRVGRLVVHHFPSYSPRARHLLRSVGGQEEFRRLYGDYFIRGLTLGADAGVCLAAHSHSKDSREQLKVKITVKILFVSASVEHVETSENHEASADLTVSGYSTMGGDNETLATKSTSSYDQQRIREVAARYMTTVSRLEADVTDAMQGLKLREGGQVQLSSTFDVCRSGLVVQVLLFPFRLTQEYLDLAHSQKVI